MCIRDSRAPGQERFTRLKTLGADYTEEAVRERIAGRRTKAVSYTHLDVYKRQVYIIPHTAACVMYKM